MLLLLLAEELQGLWGQRESHEALQCWKPHERTRSTDSCAHSAAVENMDVKGKHRHCLLTRANDSATDKTLDGPFYSHLYGHELSHCSSRQPSTCSFFLLSCANTTWLPEKHSVHISGSPTLEIKLNKNHFPLSACEGRKESDILLGDCSYTRMDFCARNRPFVFGLHGVRHANGNGVDGFKRKSFQSASEERSQMPTISRFP